jgi:hypothetical protein
LCAVGSKFEVTGPAFIREAFGESGVEKERHFFEEGPLTELKFGTNKATIDGSALVYLTGAHFTEKFSVHAG